MSALLDFPLRPIRVLVADDDEAVLNAYRQIFTRVATTAEGDTRAVSEPSCSLATTRAPRRRAPCSTPITAATRSRPWPPRARRWTTVIRSR